MNTNKDESLLFASENSIFRIVSIAKILSWIILVFFLFIFLYSFVQGIIPMIGQAAARPQGTSQWVNLLFNLLYQPFTGLVYFLVLQGVAEGLNLGLDIFYELHPDEDEEEVLVVEEK